MVYRIMFVEKEKDNLGNIYRFDTIDIDGEIKYREFKTETEIDDYVEYLLNDAGYAKKDFIVVSIRDYNVDADIYEQTTWLRGENYDKI